MTAEDRVAAVTWEGLLGLAPALEPPIAEILAGAPAERVLDRFLRGHRALDRAGRAAAAEALFGVGLWRRRLRHHLGDAPETPRLLLALLLRDLGRRGDAAALTGLEISDLPPPRSPPVTLADRWSLPDWLAAALLDAAGDQAGAVAEALCRPGPICLRVNTLHATRAELAVRLAADGITTRPGALSPLALLVAGARPNLLA